MSSVEAIREYIDPTESTSLKRLDEVRAAMGNRLAIARASTFKPTNTEGSAILTAYKAQRIIERMR